MGLAVFSVYYLRFYVPGRWILFGDAAIYGDFDLFIYESIYISRNVLEP
jgi:hypothetical protein